MSEENKSVVREFFEEVVNADNLDRADELVSPGYVEHQELPGGEDRQGIEVAKGFQSLMRRAFPDFRFEVEDLIAEGDKVAARVSVSGTYPGEMMGLPRPASGLAHRVSRCSASRKARWLSTGRCLRRWICCNR
jgi:predicted ester cyclase